MPRTTPHQQRVLDALQLASPGSLTVPELAAAVGAPPEGASQTASSLVRRGQVTKARVAGRVTYRIVLPWEA